VRLVRGEGLPPIRRRACVSPPPLTAIEFFPFQWGLFSRLGLTFWCAVWRGLRLLPCRAVRACLVAFCVSGAVSGMLPLPVCGVRGLPGVLVAVLFRCAGFLAG